MKLRQTVATLLLAFIFGQPLILIGGATPQEPEVEVIEIELETADIYISPKVVEEFTDTVERTYVTYDVDLSVEKQIQIIDICESRGYEPEFLFAIAYVETHCTESTIGDHGNSLGMYQIQPKWWNIGDRDLFDAVDSTYVACDILDYLYEHYTSTERVLNAYNTGSPNNYNGYSVRVLKTYAELKGE